MKKKAMALVLFALAFAPHARAQAGSQRVSLGFTSQGFWGLYASWEYCFDAEARAGFFYGTSALMLVQGVFDAGEVGACAHWDRVLPDGFESSFGLEAGYRYQSHTLGIVQSAFSRQSARFSRRFSAVSPGLEIVWDQTWLAHIRYGRLVSDTFSDRYEGCSSAPSGTTLLFPATRFRFGLAAGIHLPRETELSVSGGVQWAPNPFVSGFDGMMFGHFPFYADIGVRIPVSGSGTSE